MVIYVIYERLKRIAVKQLGVKDEEVVPSANFVDYEIPRAFDVPEITTIDASDPDSNGSFGAKEVGECARAAVIGSIVNAVYDATKVKPMSLPLHPEKIFRGLKEKAKA